MKFSTQTVEVFDMTRSSYGFLRVTCQRPEKVYPVETSYPLKVPVIRFVNTFPLNVVTTVLFRSGSQ
jgi:hypothetical protein